MVKIVDRASGKVVAEYDSRNIKWMPTDEDIQKMRELGDGAYFIVELQGMKAGQAWWHANRYDLVRA